MSGTKALRVVVADDHVVFREGLTYILEDRGFDVVGTAGDVVGAAALVRQYRPDLAVLDVHMPGGSASALVRTIRTDSPNTRIAMLSMLTSAHQVEELEEIGISAYLSKVVDGATLCAVLTAAAYSRGVGRIRVTPHIAGSEYAVVLTAEEKELLVRIAAGNSNKGIAQELYVSESTIKRRLHALYDVLGVSNRAGAINRVHELGLVRFAEAIPAAP